MIRTPQEFVNEVRARFRERLNDEIDEQGRTVIHLAEENNRLRKEVGRLRSAVKLLDAAAGPYCAPELRPVLIAEARAAIGEEKP